MRAKRILLAWEQGAGFGHTTQLAFLARRLMAAGAQVAAAVRYRENARPLTEAGVRIVDAPAWRPPAPRPHDHLPASATLTDTLARAGLRDAGSVRAALAAWRDILDAERPDLLVCDYAPLAAPTARGRCPVMQAGTAYCLPPAGLAQMPALHDFAPPLHTDAEVLCALNDAFADAGLAPVDRIAALFDGDDVFVRTFAIIDPYADVRDRQAEGPLLARDIPQVQREARGVFAYLHTDVAGRSDVAQALVALGPELEVYIPGASGTLMQALRAAGARVHDRPAPLDAVLPRSRLVLHQGSAGIATEALLAGVPQLTLSVHVEHYINGEALAAAGVGRNLPLFDSATRVEVAAIRAMMGDADTLTIAGAAARMHRALLAQNPLDVLTDRCLALL